MRVVASFFFALQIVIAPIAASAAPAVPSLTTAPAGTKSFDPATATRAWLDTVPAEARARSDAYFEGGYWLLLWNFLLSAAIAIFMLVSGLSARLRDFAERATRFRVLQPAFYAVSYVLIVAALSFR